MNEDLVRLSLVITGTVQEVFFRASTLEQAQGMGLTGWVKNLSDGSIEIVAEGPRYALEQLLAWCQHGPPAARVAEVFPRWGKHMAEFRTFMIVR